MIDTAASRTKDLEKVQDKEAQMAEADDVLNVDCTDEVDEFTNFLNEFEDELKDKPSKETDGKSEAKPPRYTEGENKVGYTSSIRSKNSLK